MKETWHIQRMMFGGEVTRFHAGPYIKQTVASHSWGVAMIVQRLHPECSKALLLAALEHDMAEQETGDIPGYFKDANPNIEELLIQAEAKAMASIGFNNNLLSINEHGVLAIADKLELYAFAKLGVLQGSMVSAAMADRLENIIVSMLTGLDLPQPIKSRVVQLFDEIYGWTTVKTPDMMGEV